ncbi:hypothetical protein C8Q69DRAFT_480754 [Paecilomyces variotii]|uniref:Uncharacterized protein n=1 Tax=Byssochlamys spectabilis TaxID=264951 RepID=A0A443HJI9_BYSSP|nr:hypothetical protein C8Q69DRAFT_480754 [Paecilomyces variotii]RWQ91949.1 hypothetical protein C8Q69DRAFT_480754 [Paecilomyces variotii]
MTNRVYIFFCSLSFFFFISISGLVCERKAHGTEPWVRYYLLFLALYSLRRVEV